MIIVSDHRHRDTHHTTGIIVIQPIIGIVTRAITVIIITDHRHNDTHQTTGIIVIRLITVIVTRKKQQQQNYGNCDKRKKKKTTNTQRKKKKNCGNCDHNYQHRYGQNPDTRRITVTVVTVITDIVTLAK